jgi:predicted metal-dependent HD superfamily phosphohydrolase
VQAMVDLMYLWKELTSRYTSNLTLVDELWGYIHQHYTARKRYYHNLHHLEYLAGLALEHKKQLSDLDTVLFSIFYHDIIYATVAQEMLTKLGVPVAKVARCQKQILATKNHGVSIDPDTNFLVDIDLAVLGEGPETYQDYAHKIRSEYAIYPDFLYKNGRKKVLQHFLDMERIFKTDAFFKTYELQARVNLSTELLQL